MREYTIKLEGRKVDPGASFAFYRQLRTWYNNDPVGSTKVEAVCIPRQRTVRVHAVEGEIKPDDLVSKAKKIAERIGGNLSVTVLSPLEIL